jgi:hypothetical protein
VHPGPQSSPFVTLTSSLPLISPAVASGHLPRAPVRSGARYLVFKKIPAIPSSVNSVPW